MLEHILVLDNIFYQLLMKLSTHLLHAVYWKKIEITFFLPAAPL